MSEHTPTPWALMGRGDIIGVCKGFPQKPVAKVLGQETSKERAANIDLIIKAVNSHEALVKALGDALCELSHCATQLAARGLPGHEGDSVSRAQKSARDVLNDLITVPNT
jgi:hypothetical protein